MCSGKRPRRNHLLQERYSTSSSIGASDSPSHLGKHRAAMAVKGADGRVLGDGLKSYYRAKIEELEILCRDKQHNLRRLEAQRNELNTKGERISSPLPPLSSPPHTPIP